MFGMVTFTPTSGDEEGEVHISPVGLEIEPRSGGDGTVITRPSGRAFGATESPAEIRCRVEAALEQRSPVLRVAGNTGDKGTDPSMPAECFYINVREIRSIFSRVGMTYLYTDGFTVSTKHHDAQTLGELWQAKMAFLNGSRA